MKRLVNSQSSITLGSVLLRIFKHLDDREMSLTDQRIIVAIMLCNDPKVGLPVRDIAQVTGLSKTEVENRIPTMIETRHLFEVVPIYGDRITYKLGNVGQTFVNAITRELDRAEQAKAA